MKNLIDLICNSKHLYNEEFVHFDRRRSYLLKA